MNRDTLKAVKLIYPDGYRISLEELLDLITCDDQSSNLVAHIAFSTETALLLLKKIVGLQEEVHALEEELDGIQD